MGIVTPLVLAFVLYVVLILKYNEPSRKENIRIAENKGRAIPDYRKYLILIIGLIGGVICMITEVLRRL